MAGMWRVKGLLWSNRPIRDHRPLNRPEARYRRGEFRTDNGGRPSGDFDRFRAGIFGFTVVVWARWNRAAGSDSQLRDSLPRAFLFLRRTSRDRRRWR